MNELQHNLITFTGHRLRHMMRILIIDVTINDSEEIIKYQFNKYIN